MSSPRWAAVDTVAIYKMFFSTFSFLHIYITLLRIPSFPIGNEICNDSFNFIIANKGGSKYSFCVRNVI